MGDQTLSTLADQTRGAGDELRDLVSKLVTAAEPLGRTFQGQARRTSTSSSATRTTSPTSWTAR